MVVACSKNSSLGPAEIATFVRLALFKDEGRRVSPRFHLLFLMLIIGMSSRFPCVTLLMERFYLDLPRAAKNRVCTLKLGCGDVPRW